MFLHRSGSRRFLVAAASVAWLAFPVGPARAAFAPEPGRQDPARQEDGGGILHRLRKLEVLGGVLYLAAHPDDENTRLIAHLANARGVRAGYLSLTRGEGGQNLIGAEFGEALGLLRTEELLAARRIDGGEQMFTRASDFGFSKSPEEAFAKWGREAVLGDVVRAIRTFRPDVIVTRFDVDGSGGHGHHTASAILAREAFELAADPRAYPEQLAEGLAPWRTTRLFFNGSTWWRSDLAAVAAADPERWVAVDVGGYEPLLGASITEIAGRSRSQHKSQGFGSAQTRGTELEYLRLDLGPKVSSPPGGGSRDLFDGIDTTWKRVPGSEAAAEAVARAIREFDPAFPERSHAALRSARRALEPIARREDESGRFAGHAIASIDGLILQISGVVVEALGPTPRIAAGERGKVSVSVLVRRGGPSFTWRRVTGPPRAEQGAAHGTPGTKIGPSTARGATLDVGERLPENRALVRELEFQAPEDGTCDQPHWLADRNGGPRGNAVVLLPEAHGALRCTVELELPDLGDGAAETLLVDVAVVHRRVDPVAGERLARVAVVPVASLTPLDDVAIVTGDTSRVEVELEALCGGGSGTSAAAADAGLSGTIEARLPDGWRLVRAPEPSQPIVALRAGERRRVTLEIARAPGARPGVLGLAFVGPRGRSEVTLRAIAHDHVPPRLWFTPAEVKLVPLDVRVTSRRVGYVAGAGDEVPHALARLGVAVEMVDPRATDAAGLARFDAIVTGVRAYNTRDELATFHATLLDYVASGGTLVVQYVTPGSTLVVPAEKLGPAPFTVTRGRVTVEEAVPSFAEPRHPLLTTPNAIGIEDFVGWVQERGLYFAADFGERYAAPIAWSDPGEAPLSGALIACDHGAGRFVYTGLSLFRELPAGVPGAYRLLANLIARRSPRD